MFPKVIIFQNISTHTMHIKSILTVSFIVFMQFVFSQSAFHRKTDWTVVEVKAWANEQKKYPTWHGLLLYQGSDSLAHHFISRVMDQWIWFNIKRSDLEVKEERESDKSSSARLGYYYVDATKDFVKVKDY
jgi:hypothetical protein